MRRQPALAIAVDRLEHDDGVVDEPPIASVRPPSVNTFSVWPVAYSTISVIANDSGIASDTTSVPRTLCRNSRITSATRTSAWTISFLRPVVDVRTNVDWSKIGLTLQPRREALQLGDRVLHRVDDLRRVAAGDAQDVEVDGVLAVDRDGLRLRRAAVLDPRDVLIRTGLPSCA